jgi:hydroxyethylthiazole kinase-like uncharacterized protein yjeF
MRRPILTAEEMRAAEARAIAAGTSAETLMDRAGSAAAEAIWRFAGPLPALVLCGPGNNGGDGHVIARRLEERGVRVRVAEYGDPDALAQAESAPLLVDALFGTGLKRGLDPATASALMRLAGEARVVVAVDLPSGVATDDGALLSPVPDYDLTVTFATLKPCHLLQPAARHMGRLVVADIGIEAESRLYEIARPRLAAPGPDDHKYSRGYVALLAGDMPGAIALASGAAARAGAGYVRLASEQMVPGIPSAIIQTPGKLWRYLDDPRIGVRVVGPGLGGGDTAASTVQAALISAAPMVLDADALLHIAEKGVESLLGAADMPILTPHAGEFRRLFGSLGGSKVEQAREAAASSGAVIVYKGADTVVAAPDGQAAIARPASSWLASAGTGDVLTGIIAAMRARGLDAFKAACAGVWMHNRASELVGPGLVADDLLAALPSVLAECSE